MAKHVWQIDRALHNYIYFTFYYPYVRSIAALGKRLAHHLGNADRKTSPAPVPPIDIK